MTILTVRANDTASAMEEIVEKLRKIENFKEKSRISKESG